MRRLLIVFFFLSLSVPVYGAVTDTTAALELARIDELQQRLAAFVPHSFVERIQKMLVHVELWREQAGYFYKDWYETHNHLMNLKALAEPTGEMVSPDPIVPLVKLIRGMWDYVKLFILSVLSFIYLTKYVFYIVYAFVIIVILQWICKGILERLRVV